MRVETAPQPAGEASVPRVTCDQCGKGTMGGAVIRDGVQVVMIYPDTCEHCGASIVYRTRGND